jgi:hypothetical protein
MANQSRRQRANRVLITGFAGILGVITGVLWAYANPIQLVPGIIQWRIFAFLPPVIGILISPMAGFVSGYVATVVWSGLSGTFIPVHTLLVDSILAGGTGLIPALTTGRKFTLAQMASDSTTEHRRVIPHALITTGGATLVMVIGVSASFAVMNIYSFGWALLWIGLSDIVPVLIGTPIALRYGSRMIQTAHWLPTERI